MSQFDEIGDKLAIGSYDILSGAIGAGLSIAGAAAIGAKVGSIVSPGVGTLAGLIAGGVIDWAYNTFIDDPLKEYLVISLIEG